MLYRLLLRDPDGRPLTFSGFKLVEDDPNHDVWRDTSRLLTRILAGHVSRTPSSTTIRARSRPASSGSRRSAWALPALDARGPGMRVRAPLRYQTHFARTLLQVYGGRALHSTQYDFPVVNVDATPMQGRRSGGWHELPGHPG